MHSSMQAPATPTSCRSGRALPCVCNPVSPLCFCRLGCSLSRQTCPLPRAAQWHVLERERCAQLLWGALQLPLLVPISNPYRVRREGRRRGGSPTKCLPKATDNSLLITSRANAQPPHPGFSLSGPFQPPGPPQPTHKPISL